VFACTGCFPVGAVGAPSGAVIARKPKYRGIKKCRRKSLIFWMIRRPVALTQFHQAKLADRI
jgi:hypothetical protein